MAYTPINWQTGDTITADKLNRCDNGWAVESTQLFSETVTTADTGQGFAMGTIPYESQSEPPATVVITFDGTDYTVDRNAQGSYGDFGATGPDFTNYPFYVHMTTSPIRLFTSTAGVHTIALDTQAVEVSADFSKAVAASVKPLNIAETQTTYQECVDAFMANREVMYFLTDASQVSRKYWMVAFDSANLRVYFAYLNNSNSEIAITYHTVTSPDDIIY